VLAHHHDLPFYVAAPTSTIDLGTPDGAAIVVEQRDGSEVTTIAGVRVTPEAVAAHNPAFDVTPAVLVTAIVTEQGITRPPYSAALARSVRGSEV
jgi:methylthioribose-1-phosphate isomerase